MNYRKVKFEYYQVVFRKEGDSPNQRDRLFDLVQWMNHVKNISLAKRAREYRTEQARLEQAYYDVDFEYYFLHFVRLRATNIPSKAKIDANVEPFELEDDEYLGEEVTALYDEDKHILMLQRNKYSLGPSGIEEYLNLLWPEAEDTIYLRSIAIPNSFTLAKKPKVYRRINLRLADLQNHKKEGFKEKFKSPIGNIIKTFGEYNGVNAQITITVGNHKDVELNSELIKSTIDDVENNSELFSKAEIAMKDNDDTAVEVLDLFDGKAHDFATFRMENRETLNHYAIAEAMWLKYHPKNENRQAVIKSYLMS